MTPTPFSVTVQFAKLMSVATPSTQCQDRLTGPEIKEGLESGEFPTGQIVCGPVQSARSTEPYDTPDDDRNRPSNTDKPTYHISDVISSALNTRTPRRTDREPGDVSFQPRIRGVEQASAYIPA